MKLDGATKAMFVLGAELPHAVLEADPGANMLNLTLSLSDTAPFPFVFMSGVAIKPTVA